MTSGRKNLLFSLIICSAVVLIVSQECTNELLLKENNCEYYTKCLEPTYKCGANGYPLGYGNKYCSKFLANYSQYPPKGQEWISKTLICLKKALVNPFTSCKQLYDAAFDSHPRCYYESGFCDLFTDGANLLKTIKALLNTYEIQTFASVTSIKQVFDTAKLCGQSYMEKLADILKEIFGQQRFLAELKYLE